MTTKFRTGLVLGLAALATAGAGSAQIVLYEQDNFGGRSFGASNSVSNLSDTGFNDRISSGRRLSSNYPYRKDANWGP